MIVYFLWSCVVVIGVGGNSSTVQYESVSVIEDPMFLPPACDNEGLAEQFFSMVFTELNPSPPACVCVQMCQNLTVYCFPHECMKIQDKKDIITNIDLKTETNRTEKPLQIHDNEISREQSDPFVYYVDEKRAKIPDSEKLQFEFDTHSIKGNPMKKPLSGENDMKERYRKMLTLKRIPKIELRYNMKEQIDKKIHKHKNHSHILQQSHFSADLPTQGPLDTLFSLNLANSKANTYYYNNDVILKRSAIYNTKDSKKGKYEKIAVGKLLNSLFVTGKKRLKYNKYIKRQKLSFDANKVQNQSIELVKIPKRFMCSKNVFHLFDKTTKNMHKPKSDYYSNKLLSMLKYITTTEKIHSRQEHKKVGFIDSVTESDVKINRDILKAQGTKQKSQRNVKVTKITKNKKVL